MTDLIKRLQEHTGVRAEKHFKSTLWRSDALLLGVNCLEPGQVQKAHDHADQDKFYYVVEGHGRFQLGAEQHSAAAGEVVWAPAGVVHGVTNDGETRLTLLVGIAPAP
jgi:quercetin dioxygenase-like cupin family protein